MEHIYKKCFICWSLWHIIFRTKILQWNVDTIRSICQRHIFPLSVCYIYKNHDGFFFHFGGFYSFWKLLTTVSMQSAVISHSFETILQGYLKRRYFSVIWALIFFIFDSSPSFVHTWKQRRTFSKIKSMRLSIMARKSEDIMEKNPNTFKIFIT